MHELFLRHVAVMPVMPKHGNRNMATASVIVSIESVSRNTRGCAVAKKINNMEIQRLDYV